MASGEVSAVELTAAHHARIDAVNPVLNAVIAEAREGARTAARAADQRRASGAALPPLHGVPMTHKDTHDVAGLPTVKGSPLFVGTVPTTSSLIIDRLQATGVISTGKTNVPELAAGSHTVNSVFGTTVNPWDTSRSASGSSGGVAAVIAAGIQPAGDGSDMGGSLRTPASFTNTVGFRSSSAVADRAPDAALRSAGVLGPVLGAVAGRRPGRILHRPGWTPERRAGGPGGGGRHRDGLHRPRRDRR